MTDQNLQDVYTLQIRRHSTSAPPSPYCEACKNGFLHVNSLQVRQFTQSGKLPGVCRACNTAFMRICRLQIRHLNANDHQPHVCDICNKTFTHAGNYKKHKFLHEQGALKSDKKTIPEPPYYCTKKECGRVFMKYGSYVKHVKNHDAVEQWRCGECANIYTSKLELTQHLENNVCNLCKLEFKCNSAVRKHKLNCKVATMEKPKTKEEIKREAPTKMNAINEVISNCTPEETVLVREENGRKILTYRCNYCSKIFKRWGTLRKHVYLHDDGGRKYTCATCFHTFNSEMLKIHVPHCTELSTPHVCKMCKKRFSVVEELENHMLEHVEENRAAINQRNQEQSQTASEDSEGIFPTTSNAGNEVGKVTSQNATTRPIIFRLSVQESPKKPVPEIKEQEVLELGEEDEDFVINAIENEDIEEEDQAIEESQHDVESDLEVQSNEEVGAEKFKHFCSVCQKGFVNLGALKNHFSVHTGDVAYECNICQKRFTQAAKLKKHALIHKKTSLRKKVEEKGLIKSKFPCKRCPRGFKTLGALRVHTASHRRGKK